MKAEATEALPDIRFLDEAARAVGVTWSAASTSAIARECIVTHAHSLERIEQLERERDDNRRSAQHSADVASNAIDDMKAAERQRDAAMGALNSLPERIQALRGLIGTCPGLGYAEAEARSVIRALAQIDAITEGEGL